MGNQNHWYVGVFRDKVDPDKFFENLKKLATEKKLPAERMKYSTKKEDFSLECHSEIANLARKQKEVLMFRCDKVFIEEDKKN